LVYRKKCRVVIQFRLLLTSNIYGFNSPVPITFSQLNMINYAESLEKNQYVHIKDKDDIIKRDV